MKSTEKNFVRDLYDRSSYLSFTVREFVDATSAAVNKYLPKISTNPEKDYYYVKIDSSANSVTINAASGDTIEGAATLVLAAQYDWCLLYPYNGVWYRIP